MNDSWPNLFVPGAAKSGTTTLHYCLNQHADIWMSSEKEPSFFSSEQRYDSVKSKQYYRSLFSKGGERAYRGESSTDYMAQPEIIPRIKSSTHNPKFIFILRNPIDRVYSHYTSLVGTGFETQAFKLAFIQSVDKDTMPNYHRLSLYYELLLPYYKHFNEKNIHIILTEDLLSNPTETINSCFVFLGLGKINTIEVPRLNPTTMLTSPSFYRNSMYWLSAESDNWVKSFYRNVFSDRLRITIRKQIIKTLDFVRLRFAGKRRAESLSESERLWLKSYYFKDVASLKRLSKKDLWQWKDFNN